MNDHGQVRELLELAVAGALGADEERRVREHVSSCPECSIDLEWLRRMASELKRIPAPKPPPEMAARARSRVLAELAAIEERRWDNVVLGFLTLFAWTVSLSTWFVVRLLSGGLLALLDVRFMSRLTWLAGSTILVWMTAGAAALLLQHRRQQTRRLP